MEVTGVVDEALPNALFRVRLGDGQAVLAHVPAAQRLRFVKLLPGARVTVELSQFDHTRGRILRQLK
ncbi:MAG: translation initiation factor IF-1 [Chloroflexi bacterium]|nr:translation initiation factor IF-1 [Chloroflexota bacterium]